MLLDGKAPLAGQILKLPNMAKTFRSLADHGKDGFYTGRIAEAIVDIIKSKGGVMELEDLAKHGTSFVEPIKYTYGGEVTVYEVSHHLTITSKRKSYFVDTSAHLTVKVNIIFDTPEKFPSLYLTGITALLALGILDNIQEMGKVKPLLQMEHNSAEYLHTLIEALRCVLNLQLKLFLVAYYDFRFSQVGFRG